MESTRIIAIRHGETTWNVDTRIQGQLDIPLNETGRWQAHRLALALAGEDIQAIYASDLTRAWETAQYVGQAQGLTVTKEIGLRERDFGDFEGKTFAEIEVLLPEQSMLWRKRDPHFYPAGGESLLALRTRVMEAAQRLAAQHPGEQIVVVSHESPIFSYRHYLETGHPEHWMFLRHTALASVTSVTYDNETGRVMSITYVDPAANVK